MNELNLKFIKDSYNNDDLKINFHQKCLMYYFQLQPQMKKLQFYHSGKNLFIWEMERQTICCMKQKKNPKNFLGHKKT